jgi:hypothetical protein
MDCLSDKNFFHELSEYLFSVDKYLFNNICSYHSLIKNSVIKVIEPPNNIASDNANIKSEVCFFKNIFNTEDGAIPRTIKARKRLRLEFAIKSKMQMLKSDWKEFLRVNYSELFSNEILDDQDNFKSS